MKQTIILISVFFIASCTTPEDTDHCGNMACTEEFRTVTITINDQLGEAYILDTFKR